MHGNAYSPNSVRIVLRSMTSGKLPPLKNYPFFHLGHTEWEWLNWLPKKHLQKFWWKSCLFYFHGTLEVHSRGVFVMEIIEWPKYSMIGDREKNLLHKWMAMCLLRSRFCTAKGEREFIWVQNNMFNFQFQKPPWKYFWRIRHSHFADLLH